MACERVAELAGYWSALAAVLAAFLLAYPLFHLLRTREAIEDLETDYHEAEEDPENARLFRESARDLRTVVRRKRARALRIAILGVVLLLVALILALLQGWCLR